MKKVILTVALLALVVGVSFGAGVNHKQAFVSGTVTTNSVPGGGGGGGN
jgi:hypothetical protein